MRCHPLPFLSTTLVAWVLVLMSPSPTPGQDSTKPLAPSFSGEILTVDIQAEHLGIVLDISESMNRALPTVKEVLRTKVPKTPVVHVDGCRLEKPAPRAAVEAGTAPEPVTAISALAEKAGADTILWISDQGDPHVRDGIIALDEILTKHELRIFIISLKNKPTPSLRKLTEGSRGKWAMVQITK